VIITAQEIKFDKKSGYHFWRVQRNSNSF